MALALSHITSRNTSPPPVARDYDILETTCERVERDGSLDALVRDMDRMVGGADEALVMATLYARYERGVVDARLADAAQRWAARHPIRAWWRSTFARGGR